MKKYTMLGVNTDKNTCCVLQCLLPFSWLIQSEIEKSDFSYSATNWSGNDDIQRTLAIKNLTRTGHIIKLPTPIIVHGADSDAGLEHKWTFSFDEIHETQPM